MCSPRTSSRNREFTSKGMQARRQEIKWGGGCKKVERGCFLVKSGPFSTQGALCTVSVIFILHFTYLGGCVRTQRTPPLPTGLRRRKERKERGDGKSEPNG